MTQAARRTLAATASGRDRLVGPLLVLALALLVAGLAMPAITVRQFLFGREFSLFDSVLAFWEAGDYFLFAVTLVFTILFPIAKILICLVLWYAADVHTAAARRLAQAMSVASKWSML